jgi:putative hydrolase of HD superfamily
MALIHDFGEIYAGDFIPHDRIEPNQKYQLEKQSVLQVLSKLNHGAEWIALWEEYEKGESTESQFVRQIDRLEMLLQASVYEHQGLANLSEFFTSTNQVFATSPLKSILNALEELRANLELHKP